MEKPHFIIKNKFQKRSELYSDILTPEVLKDVCRRVTGCTEYTCKFDNTGYNKGRLAVLEYKGKKNYISFSEVEIKSRNSSFQSFPSALARYILEKSPNKDIFFYFHPSTTGNFETPYFKFMYRLMKTAKVNFLNADEYLTHPILPFSTAEDIIANKNQIRIKNRGNKSTYITRGTNNKLQIFGKTYGANKYETTILCIALSEIAISEIELYQIGEGGLTELPEKAKEAIKTIGKVRIYTSDRTIEKINFEKNNSLRSIEYVYNLLERLGPKKCAFCNCEIPQLVEGAHIWPVADIKRESNLSQNQKLKKTIDGNNGIWLCQNHHKLLDFHILIITNRGELKIQSDLDETSFDYIKNITKTNQISETLLTSQFVGYLEKRNRAFQGSQYLALM